jgi:hypothetical protein
LIKQAKSFLAGGLPLTLSVSRAARHQPCHRGAVSLAAGSAPLLFALSYDLSGSYDGIPAVSVGLFSLGALSLLALGKPKQARYA